MTLLILAAVIWIGVHVGLAGSPLRGALVARLGEGGFRGVFSLLSVGAIGLLVFAWIRAPRAYLWVAPDPLLWALAGVMLLALFFFVASVTVKNPTSAGQDALLSAEPRGVVRVTRHPMLWGFALWAAVHVAGNGELSACVFFGAFLVTALAGMPSIDGKLAARDPAGFGALAARTSILPFGAVLAGRNRLSLAEIGWIPPAVAIVVWAALLRLHPWLFGVAPVPTW